MTTYEIRCTEDASITAADAGVRSRHDTLEEAVRVDLSLDDRTIWRAIWAVEDGEPRALTPAEELIARKVLHDARRQEAIETIKALAFAKEAR